MIGFILSIVALATVGMLGFGTATPFGMRMHDVLEGLHGMKDEHGTKAMQMLRRWYFRGFLPLARRVGMMTSYVLWASAAFFALTVVLGMMGKHKGQPLLGTVGSAIAGVILTFVTGIAAKEFGRRVNRLIPPEPPLADGEDEDEALAALPMNWEAAAVFGWSFGILWAFGWLTIIMGAAVENGMQVLFGTMLGIVGILVIYAFLRTMALVGVKLVDVGEGFFKGFADMGKVFAAALGKEDLAKKFQEAIPNLADQEKFAPKIKEAVKAFAGVQIPTVAMTIIFPHWGTMLIMSSLTLVVGLGYALASTSEENRARIKIREAKSSYMMLPILTSAFLAQAFEQILIFTHRKPFLGTIMSWVGSVWDEFATNPTSALGKRGPFAALATGAIAIAALALIVYLLKKVVKEAPVLEISFLDAKREENETDTEFAKRKELLESRKAAAMVAGEDHNRLRLGLYAIAALPMLWLLYLLAAGFSAGLKADAWVKAKRDEAGSSTPAVISPSPTPTFPPPVTQTAQPTTPMAPPATQRANPVPQNRVTRRAPARTGRSADLQALCDNFGTCGD